MKKINADRILLYLTMITVLSLLAYTLKEANGRPGTVYVDIGKLLEGYKFKKDLEAEGTKNLYRIKNAVDSLKLARKVDPNPLIDSQIIHAERAFEQYYNYSNQEMTKKVWDRLNPLMEAFGKENNYELIVGANGAGTVLYGSKKSDITEELIRYTNKKYEQGN